MLYLIVLFFVSLFINGCSHNVETKSTVPIDKEDEEKLGFGSLLGKETLNFDFLKTKIANSAKNPMLPIVNQCLWDATLQTLDFMPLITADAFNGCLITDWYITKNKRERLKIKVIIKGQELRSDALMIRIYKQKEEQGIWINQMSDPVFAQQLEQLILKEARRMNLNS